MRRIFIATLLLALVALPAFAQRGGGHGGGGGHAMGASHAGFSGHSFSGHSVSVRSGSGFASRVSSRPALRAPAFRGRTSIAPNFHRPFSPGLNRFRGPRIRNFRNCFGCQRPFGWYAGYYDPWWWWDSDSSYGYDEDQAREMELAAEMNQQSLEEQQMRQQADQDAYAQQARVAPRNESISAETAAPATVLVFHDQHQQEVQNYAIVGETLWAFAPQRTQKIPLSELDIPATQKANDDRGVEFRVPVVNEGQ